MNIKILQLLEGAKQATGLTVVIDVFRAYSLEAYLLSMGAEKIIPVGKEEIAYKLKEENPDMILAGERGGKIMPGFDIGNSPAQAKSLDVAGKTVIHTTSAGTQGIANAVNADEIIGGSLVTAKAIAKYIRRSGKTDISLVCMGLAALTPTEEDTLCARYIKALLEGTADEIDFEKEIEILKNTSGAKFFDKSKSDVFPEEDFHMCVEVDKFNFVPKLVKSPDGLDYITKVVID